MEKTTMHDDVIYIKGHSWTIARIWLLERYGTQALDIIKNAVPPEARQALFEREIIAVSRVNYKHFIQALESADKTLASGDFSLVDQLSTDAAEQQFKGIFSIFFRIISVKHMFGNFSRAWKQQYGRGKLSFDWKSETQVLMNVEDFPAPRNHELVEFAYHKKMLTLAGAKNLTVRHPKCYGRGDGICVYDYRWD